jgi:hypothetical protein
MNLLIAFSPFIAFALLERFVGVVASLGIAAALAAVFLVRDWLSPGRHVKLLEVGSVLLFGGLAIGALVTGASWSVLEVRLKVDAGLLAIVVASLVFRRPFTMQYAKEQVSESAWRSARFLRTQMVLTAAWGTAFLLMVIADALMLYRPAIPLSVGVVVTVIALAGAFRFTNWYVQRVKASAKG